MSITGVSWPHRGNGRTKPFLRLEPIRPIPIEASVIGLDARGRRRCKRNLDGDYVNGNARGEVRMEASISGSSLRDVDRLWKLLDSVENVR